MTDTPQTPFDPFFDRQGVVILDGGLATELEARGHDLSDRLWSARLLLTAPQEIVAVHRTYLDAGADCIITASYQASVPGLTAEGMFESQALQLIADSVALACEARDAFVADQPADTPRLRPIIAASVGPYGAYLADGSEYRGNYGVSSDALRTFHAQRLHALANSGADVIACETIPDITEIRVLVELLADVGDTPAWMSFSCRDGATLRDGTPVEEAVHAVGEARNVVAIGVNCISPDHAPSLIGRIRRISSMPVLAYPNSGERWSAGARGWVGPPANDDFAALSEKWYNAGAVLIGGCCRTGPSRVSAIRGRLVRRQQHDDRDRRA